jgi:hypothetical protein
MYSQGRSISSSGSASLQMDKRLRSVLPTVSPNAGVGAP